MTTDTTNNLYIVGNYTSSTIVSLSNLNGTYSSYTLPIRNPLSVGKTTFLIKYSSSGLIQGRTTLNISGNTTYETDGNFVITDTSGNLYLTGYYSSSATVALTNLDGTSSSYTLPTLGITRKYYLIKYSTDGLVRGVTYISALSVGQSMTVNNSGNIIVLANYTPTGVLVPLYNLDGTQSSYSLSGFILSAIYVPFIVQYSPSGIVTLGTDLGFYGTAITSTIDNNGILVISGILTDTTVQYVKNLDGTLSSYTIYDNGSYNSFTIVYSPSGKVQGVSIQRASSIRINQSLVSSSGNIYILGYYTSSTNVPLSNLDGTASSSNLPITLSFNYPYVIQYSPTSLPTTTSYVRTLPNTLSVQQTPTGQEFPPVGISNIYFAPDYTDTIASIDIGQSLSNLEYPPSAMNNYDTTLFSTYGAGTYTASASSQYDSTNYLAWKLFTKLNANVSNWTSYSGSYSSGNYVSTGTTITYDISGNRYRGEWVQIQLPISIQLQVYQLSVFSTSANSNPYTWYIFGSIDGINWILINTQTAISWTASAIRNFTVQTNTYYSYYRMVISQVDGATPYCVINQWRLFTNSILGQNRYPKYKATIPYYTSTNSYGLGQYQIWANTIQDYSFSNQAVPTGLFTKTVGSTSNTVWASYSNVYTSTVDALSSNLPIIYAQFPDLIQLNSYSITARGGNALETPSKWTLFGSNTTITSAWQTVDVESNITNWSAFQTSNFSVSGSNTYNFYKLELYRNSSPVPTRMSMGELRFYGSKPESRLTVSSAGFVGIGTTMAQTALINGDIFIEGVLGNSILNSGPNLNFDGSSNSKNTFLSWLQYVTSTEYRFALQPRTFQTCWWATNFGTPTQYNGYTYSTVSGPPGNYAHRGGVLLLDGRVLLNQWVYTSIGIFTPYTNTYSTPITGIPAYSYFGGVLLPDGRVVLVPFDATNIGIFNPNTNIFTTIAGAPGGNAYIGGVLLPDGRVLFVPYSATTIGFFNPTTNTYSTILRGSGTGSYFGGVLLPDGRVIFVPLQATYVGIFNSITNTYTTILGAPGSSAYAGGVLVPDGRVIFTPSSATTIGIFNPTTNSYTSILGAPGSVAYEGGVLLPDGRVFFIPNNSATFGFFNPLTNTYTTQSGAPGSGAFSGGILLPDGRVILCPYNSTNFLGIMTPTQLSRPPPLELCYHPCFNKF
jgi:streptogramin lyase